MGENTITVIGNGIALVGCFLMVASGFVKRKTNVLIVQCVQSTILGIANFVLGGLSGVITNVVTIIRNLITFKLKFTIWWKLIFIALQIGLTIIFNNLGFIGWLPIIGACILTWFLDTKSDLLIKAIMIVTQIMWAIFDFTILNYITLVFDCIAVVTNSIGIVLILKGNTKTKKELKDTTNE